MNGQENRLNDALRQLGEEYRLGMVPAEEYRARRRLLLQSWGERDITTSPGLLNRSLRATAAKSSVASPANAVTPPPTSHSWSGWLLGAVLVLVLGGGAYALFGSPGAAPARAVPVASAKPAVARSAGLIALTQAAAEFLDRNQWEPADLDAFAQQWRMLPATERESARSEPAIRSLRHQLEQNIRAETQALGGNTEGNTETEQRSRLDGLVQFARELDGAV